MSEDNFDVGVRDRKLTDKGREYQISVKERCFMSSLSTWRGHSNKLHVLLSDTIDLNVIRVHRDILQTSFEEFLNCFKDLQNLKEDVSREAEKFENTELSHQNVMQSVAERIREIENQKFETGSHRSAHSNTSRQSKKSNFSHISDTAARKAALRAELKYIDTESMFKAELEKIKISKRKEIAIAELDALERPNANLDTDIESWLNTSLPQVVKSDYVKDYVTKHSLPQNGADVKTSNVELVPITCTPSTLDNKASIASGIFSNTERVSLIVSSANNLPVPSASLAPNVSHVLSGAVQSSSATVPNYVTSLSSVSQPNYTSSNRPLKPIVTSGLNPSVNTFVPKVHAIASHGHGFYIPSSSGIPNGTSFVSGTEQVKEQEIVNLTKTLVEQVNLSRLPSPEPSTFYGDPLQYPSWKLAFKTLIDQRSIPAAERIHYLRKYLGGSVRQVVENFLLIPTDDAYEEARKLLDERYGDSFVVANSFRNKLDGWPKVNTKDPQGLLKFSDFLKQCHTALQTVPHLTVLNDPVENRKLISKLPEWLVTRWNRIVVSHKETHNEFPQFKAFVDFVAREAKIANDPVTSLSSIKNEAMRKGSESYDKTQGLDKRLTHKGKTFFAGAKEQRYSQPGSQNVSNLHCFLCLKNHELDVCRSFLAKALTERKAFIQDKKLCFSCLTPGHISRKCRRRKQCQVCFKFHPTSLHGDLKNTQSIGPRPETQHTRDQTEAPVKDRENQASSSGVSFLNSSGSCSKTSMVVPVYISHCDSPEFERLIYAMLDTQSDTTFVLRDTCDALGVSGPKVNLILSTMHAKHAAVESSKVRGLVVRGVNSPLRITLPDVFSREIIPANKSHIPTPDVARTWPHLECIADQLMPLADCEVGLLIGYNCARALMPREIIPPVDKGPFGQRTDLGWGIVGIVDPISTLTETDEYISQSHRACTFVVPTDLSPGTSRKTVTEEVTFCFRTHVKVTNPADVTRMMELDFSERHNTCSPISHNDRQFLSKMNDGIRFVDGHYTMPLPFKTEAPSLPNNKNLALHRLSKLKGRLQNDKSYHNHYELFMNNLIERGHAERVPESEIDKACWYIPHHGVYHPRKPGKLRVVFDCSSQFKGESLNGHLLQGPDLTNTLIGVLCRFRMEPIAFICDIEQMFHQFCVNEEHRDYLRFFWWSDKGMSKPVAYRMCVHLFGASSSPGCANFGLKQVAMDGEVKYGKTAADFLRHHFYVDDGLKSMASVAESVQLIEQSQAMCKEGGLRLHKFASNSKEVLNHISPDDRVSDLSNIDIFNQDLPVERVLGVQWCVESDSFQFRIVLCDKPFTRRGILSTVSSIYDPLGIISPVTLVGKHILQQMCGERVGWDDPISDEHYMRWDCWRQGLHELQCLQVKRCVKPPDFGELTLVEFHHFSDASASGYGQCSYLRLRDQSGQIHCSFLMGKARAAPLKSVTIPRLELTAAVVSVRVSDFLNTELVYGLLLD